MNIDFKRVNTLYPNLAIASCNMSCSISYLESRMNITHALFEAAMYAKEELTIAELRAASSLLQISIGILLKPFELLISTKTRNGNRKLLEMKGLYSQAERAQLKLMKEYAKFQLKYNDEMQLDYCRKVIERLETGVPTQYTAYLDAIRLMKFCIKSSEPRKQPVPRGIPDKKQEIKHAHEQCAA